MDLYILPGTFQTLLFPLHFTVPRTRECINNGYLNENKVCVYMDGWMDTIVPHENQGMNFCPLCFTVFQDE